MTDSKIPRFVVAWHGDERIPDSERDYLEEYCGAALLDMSHDPPRVVGTDVGEPEDMCFSRDLGWVEYELNELAAEVERLKAEVARLTPDDSVILEEARTEEETEALLAQVGRRYAKGDVHGVAVAWVDPEHAFGFVCMHPEHRRWRTGTALVLGLKDAAAGLAQMVDAIRQRKEEDDE